MPPLLYFALVRRGGEAVTQLFAEQIYRGSIPLRASIFMDKEKFLAHDMGYNEEKMDRDMEIKDDKKTSKVLFTPKKKKKE